jgi:hypothetical protein
VTKKTLKRIRICRTRDFTRISWPNEGRAHAGAGSDEQKIVVRYLLKIRGFEGEGGGGGNSRGEGFCPNSPCKVLNVPQLHDKDIRDDNISR